MTLLPRHVTFVAVGVTLHVTPDAYAQPAAGLYHHSAVLGLEGRLVEVQMDIAHQGLPNFLKVGVK